ncbi:MAG TPA: response regulator transcription factor [Chloroflexaceae bacterium]|nr:response regulator transcription factor [Chloroflexaceae bacterium]
MTRILVVDDDPAVTSVLRRGLSYEGYTVTIAADGPAGLAAAREAPPDLVVLDIMMPGLNGLEVLRRLRAADATLPVLMLTARDTPAEQVQGLETGADDYMVKPFSFEVLLAHIRALLRRREAEQPQVLRYADLALEPARHAVFRGERPVTLTSLEFKLLHEFLRHAEQVLPKELLLDRVWGYDFGGNANVVEVYVKQLRQKLESGGESRLLHTIRGAGYVLRQEGA